MLYSPKQRFLLQDTQPFAQLCTSSSSTYILEVTEGVRYELAQQSPHRTKLEPQKRGTENESKVNNHNYVICIGAKAPSKDGLGELVKFLYPRTCKFLNIFEPSVSSQF